MKTTTFFIFVGMLLLTSCNLAKTDQPVPAHSDLTNTIENVYLLDTLEAIWRSEQEPIHVRDSLGAVHGYESEEFQIQNERYHRIHDGNEKKILKLLDTQGWPHISVVGEQGHLTICNVLQHSGMDVRQKYIPVMKKAVQEKGLAPRLLARSEDRLATDRGELQIYGGQIKYYPETQSFNVWPILDPENVDKRRAKIGLDPMAEFLSRLRNPIKWDVDEQIKRTREFRIQMGQIDS